MSNNELEDFARKDADGQASHSVFGLIESGSFVCVSAGSRQEETLETNLGAPEVFE